MDKLITISDDLIKAALHATGETDERNAIEHAVRDYIQTSRNKTAIDGVLSLSGQSLLRDDYKALRMGGQDDCDR